MIPINDSVFVYARVSSNSRRKELDYQVNRIIEFANSNGFKTTKVFKEVASGMNDNRTQFWKMIDHKPSVIIIENKDRLTRFGYNYIGGYNKSKKIQKQIYDNHKEKA